MLFMNMQAVSIHFCTLNFFLRAVKNKQENKVHNKDVDLIKETTNFVSQVEIKYGGHWKCLGNSRIEWMNEWIIINNTHVLNEEEKMHRLLNIYYIWSDINSFCFIIISVHNWGLEKRQTKRSTINNFCYSLSNSFASKQICLRDRIIQTCDRNGRKGHLIRTIWIDECVFQFTTFTNALTMNDLVSSFNRFHFTSAIWNRSSQWEKENDAKGVKFYISPNDKTNDRFFPSLHFTIYI